MKELEAECARLRKLVSTDAGAQNDSCPFFLISWTLFCHCLGSRFGDKPKVRLLFGPSTQ